MDLRVLPSATLAPSARVIGVPGAHYRVSSAKAALEALDGLRPEAIAVEMPNAVIPGICRALEEDYPTPCGVCLNPLKGGPGHVFVVSPSDSMMQACRWALRTGTPLFGVDLLTRDDCEDPPCPARPASAVTDDWAWYTSPFPAELRPWNARWRREKTPSDLSREDFMAAQLRRLASQFGRVVWVGGAAHWARLERLLTGKESSEPLAEGVTDCDGDVSVDLAYLDPAVALARYLDDLPNATWQFHCATEDSNGVSGYDKWQVLDRSIVPKALEHYGKAFEGPPPRVVRNFNLLLRRLLAGEGSLAPRLPDLWQAACASVDEHFAELLIQKALEYPFPLLRTSKPGEGGRPILTQAGADDSTLERTDHKGGRPYRVRVKSPTHVDPNAYPRGEASEDIQKQIRRAARRARGPQDGSRWEDAIPENHFGHEMHVKARRLARESTRRMEVISVPFSHALSMRHGVDIRGTLRSRARGEREVFVRNCLQTDAGLVDDHEPVVWELKDPSEFRTTTVLYGWYRDSGGGVGQSIYLSFFWANCVEVAPDLIRWDWGTSVNFCDPTCQARAREFAARNPDRVPTRYLLSEAHTGNVVEEIGLAALKYARLAVVWVSRSPETIPPSVRSVAASVGKRIIHVSAALFPPDDLERLTYYHLWRSNDWESDEMVPPQEVLERIEQYKWERLASRRSRPSTHRGKQEE